MNDKHFPGVIDMYYAVANEYVRHVKVDGSHYTAEEVNAYAASIADAYAAYIRKLA